MNSFYDAPRMPPVPTLSNRVTPVVPEVSMIIQNKPTNSYNDWKALNPLCRSQSNFGNNQGSILKKSVRFEGPQSGQVLNKPSPPINRSSHPVLNDRPINLQGKTFEEIYMANIPNRHLDLSILELRPVPEKPIEKENQQPVKLAETLPQNTEAHRPISRLEPGSITNVYDYQSPGRISTPERRGKKKYSKKSPSSFTQTRASYNSLKVDSAVQTDIVVEREGEPSIKDLFKIIHQQNEQIIQLQTQLLSLQNCNRNPQIRDVRTGGPSPRSSPVGPRKTFSIDLTSFEVSFRPPQFQRKTKEFVINEPRIQEITEIDSVKNSNDLSLNLGESMHVKENCPSPEPSIRINMDDYQTSSDIDSSDVDDDEDNASEIGITFYNNLMEQVNKVLKTAELQTNADFKDNKKKRAVTQQTMEKVKQATLKHLKSMGVNLPLEKERVQQNRSSDERKQQPQRDYKKSDVNFEVKQLLMKYLPDEQLAKISEQQRTEAVDSGQNLIPLRPEFSFATIQYMKKYNLINVDDHTKQNIMQDSNALDITKLKLQPKLL